MKSNVTSRLNKMVELIKENKSVPFGELCLKMNMSPSTMYGYKKLLRNTTFDIKYEDGLFTYVGVRKIEEMTSQRMLTNP